MTRAADPWSRHARLYDLQLPLERRAIRTLLEMVAPAAPDRLLDVATGTGAVLRLLRRAPVQPARVVGVDSSAPMLARARAALGPGCELLEADATALPLPDSGFEVVTCAYLLHTIDASRRDEVLRELKRVLAPGGRLGVVTVAPPANRVTAMLGRPVRCAASRARGVLAGLRPLDPSPELERGGFEVETVRRVGFGYPSLCVLATRNGRP